MRKTVSFGKKIILQNEKLCFTKQAKLYFETEEKSDVVCETTKTVFCNRKKNCNLQTSKAVFCEISLRGGG